MCVCMYAQSTPLKPFGAALGLGSTKQPKDKAANAVVLRSYQIAVNCMFMNVGMCVCVCVKTALHKAVDRAPQTPLQTLLAQ